MSIISRYERALGQLVNVSKSSFMVGPSASLETIRRIQTSTRFSRGHLPFDYLGCPIFLGRTRINYFDGLLGKLRKKLAGWKLQLLSVGGRMQLVCHVLLSMPLHLLAVHEVPVTVLQSVRWICTSFLWDGEIDGPRRQRRISWEKACRPLDEGGLGLRRPEDVLDMLQKKVVWRMRTTTSPLGSFVIAKYGEWARQSTDVKGVKRWADWQRHWLEMMPLIRWQVMRGAISAWYDTWLEDTPLSSYTTFAPDWPRLTVAQLLHGDTSLFLANHGLPTDLLPSIMRTEIRPIEDNAIWTLTIDGCFSCRSSWEHFRNRSPKTFWGELIWHPAITPRVSFFLWKFMHHGLPTDDRVIYTDQEWEPRCHCCSIMHDETHEHLFFHSDIAIECWRHLLQSWLPTLSIAPTRPPHEVFHKVFNTPTSVRISPFIRVSIAYMLWEIWKGRNSSRYAGHEGHYQMPRSYHRH